MSPGRRGCWHLPAAPRRSSRSRRWPRWLRCRLMPRYSESPGELLKRSALTSLRAILRSAATALGVERAAHEALIAEMWSEIVGQEAAAHAHPAELRGTTLLVGVEPGLWVQELSARRGQFVEAINRRLGGRVVAEIRIRYQPGVRRQGRGGEAPVGKWAHARLPSPRRHQNGCHYVPPLSCDAGPPDDPPAASGDGLGTRNVRLGAGFAR